MRGMVLLTTYSTGAQHEPSGNGSLEANRTSTSPVCAFAGTWTSIFVGRHRRTSALIPLINTWFTPNIVLGSRDPAVFPKFSPSIVTNDPASTFRRRHLRNLHRLESKGSGFAFRPAVHHHHRPGRGFQRNFHQNKIGFPRLDQGRHPLKLHPVILRILKVPKPFPTNRHRRPGRALSRKNFGKSHRTPVKGQENRRH